MTVNELYRLLDARIPRELSCDWDNDGLMCCPEKEREVKRALIALDVTADVVDEAISKGFDLIISHHPFIFSGLKSLNESDFIPKKVMKLVKSGISVMSFHTRLDTVSGGVNDTLALLFELQNVSPFGECKMGRVGDLPEVISLSDFADKVKSVLDVPTVLVADSSKPVSRVAFLGGDGDDFLHDAITAGADTFVSGRLGYHNMTDAPDIGINLIEAGHFYTENPVCQTLAKILGEYNIAADVYFSNRIKAV